MKNILFVDDDKITLKLFKTILEGAGYTVSTALNPKEGLTLMDSQEFNLVLTDANMPGGISGYDFVKTIRATEKLKNIPILMISGRQNEEDRRQGLNSGVNEYIVKPINPTALLKKIGEFF